MRTPPEIGLRPDEILDIAEEYGRLYEVEYATFNNVLTYANGHLALFKDKHIFINSIPTSYPGVRSKSPSVMKQRPKRSVGS